jgi:toxin ParE1/3/4
MTLRIELSPAAKIDFDDASEWYRAKDESVKVHFVDAVNSTLNRIQHLPTSFPIAYGTNVRKAVVGKFPFIILFTVQVDRVLVYSVFHTSRNPIIWRGRI